MDRGSGRRAGIDGRSGRTTAIGIALVIAATSLGVGCGGGSDSSSTTATSTGSQDAQSAESAGPAFVCPVDDEKMGAVFDATVTHSAGGDDQACGFDTDPKLVLGFIIRADGEAMTKAREQAEKAQDDGCSVEDQNAFGEGAFSQYCPQRDRYPEAVQVVLRANGVVWFTRISTLGPTLGRKPRGHSRAGGHARARSLTSSCR